MCVRGLTIVKKDGEIKVAQYGRFYHDPDNHGAALLDFLQNPTNVHRLQTNIDEYVYHPHDTEMIPPIETTILDAIAQAEQPFPVMMALDFLDSPFCEGVFTIDLDEGTFKTEFHDHTVVYDLANLPSETEYTNMFANCRF